jgi:L-lysine 6-transaminase
MKPTDVHKTIGKFMLADGDEVVVDLEKSHGVYMHDAITGEEYLDFFSYFASQPIGHNHPKMRDPEFMQKLAENAVSKPSSSDFYTAPLAEFVETFVRIALPEDMKHMFLVSGGGLAVENALKVAFDWKVRKNMQKSGGKADFSKDVNDLQIIHFEQAFHGRTGYTMSLTNTADPRKFMYFPKFDWPRIVNPKLRYPVTEEVLAEVKALEAKAVAQIEAAVRDNPDQIAGLIIETIQGEGGDNHFRPEFFAELRRLADENDFLLILDEVQAGMGLTGKMWAYQNYGFSPDILAFGKKSQVCGIFASDRIDEVEGHVFEESSRLNSTWGGNLIDMVRVSRYLEIMEEENLVEHAAKVGKIFKDGLETLVEESNGLVSNVRGLGMMIAFDLPTAEKRDKMVATMNDNKMKALKSGERSIRFRGFLDMPEEVIKLSLEIIAKSLPLD